MNPRCRQHGAAMVLVMWLVAAMGVLVGGALTLAREEVSYSSNGLGTAQALALGKGLARIVVLDRTRAREAARTVDAAAQPQITGIFSKSYELDGATILATVYPAEGFVSLAESDPEVWQRLLVGLGRMDVGAASVLATNIVDSNLQAHSVRGGRLGGFQYFAQKRTGFTAMHVEQLLPVNGMTREVYDRIRAGITPFATPSGFNTAASPSDIRLALEAPINEAPGADSQAENAQYSSDLGDLCVEIEVTFPSSTKFVQRIWLRSMGSAEQSSVSFVRVETPRVTVARASG